MTRSVRSVLSLAALVLVGGGCASSTQETPVATPPEVPPIQSSSTPMNEPVRLADFSAPPSVFPGVLADADRLNRQVTLKTNKGDIVVELYGDAAPKAVSNFLVLAKTGFYDQVKFHRVIKGFMIQAGDPQSADDSKVNAWGTGGPGYRFADELGGKYTTYERGTLAMANSGSNTNGSQFFIMHADYALPNKYTVFGKVVKGLEVVDAIANTPTKPNDQPKEAIIIKSMSIK